VTRKGNIAFSFLWASSVVLDAKLANRRESPSVVAACGFGVIPEPTDLLSKRIQFSPLWFRHGSGATSQPNTPTHDVRDQIRHLNHRGESLCTKSGSGTIRRERALPLDVLRKYLSICSIRT
jgi:hypothetical protein